MTATMLRARCGKCRCRLRIPREWSGQIVRCTQCRSQFRVTRRSSSHPISILPAKVANEQFGPGESVFAGLSVAARPQARESRCKVPIVLAVAGALVLSLAALGYGFRDRLFADKQASKPSEVQQVQAPPEKKPEKKPEPKAKPAAPPAKAEVVFPRRLLAICVSQYLYANPVNFGSAKKSPAAVVDRLADKYKIPKQQQFLVTDVKSNRGAVAPMKPVIQNTIEKFVETSRASDRIVLLFAGHATVIDGKAYLVPLEGELSDAATLIELDWLYSQLNKCKARQKVLIVDVCRFDPGRGTERPSPGAMDPALEAALKQPPEGVQVWSACSAKQFSYEFRYQSFDKYEVEGGLFLNQIFNAFQKHGTATAKPESAIPVDELAGQVAPLIEAMAMGVVKETQAPFFVGTEKAGGAEYDAKEAQAKGFAIPNPRELAAGDQADAELVKGIVGEIKLPPIKAVGVDELANDDVSGVLPFAASALKGYEPDDRSSSEILKQADKFPLRAAVLRAVETLQRHGKGEVRIGSSTKQVGRLKQTFEGPLNDNAKKRVEAEQRAGPAVMLVELEEVLSALEEQRSKRADEPSKRWQAHYDYVLAIAKCRFAYLNEYNLMLGKIRKDELPTLDPNLHNGWRMASQEKMQSPRDVKDKAEEAKELFAKIIKEHAGTPWEVLARRERLTTLGLVWQPASIKEPAAAEPTKPRPRPGK